MKDISKVIETYNKTATHYAQSRVGKERKEELSKFVKLVFPHGKVLDVGCAGGRDSRILKDAGFDVTGIDLSEELLKIARQQNPDVAFSLEDMRRMSFPDNAFDGILAIAVLHHLDKDEISLSVKECYRVLKRGGVILITTKEGSGVLKVREEMVGNEEREFTLVTEEEVNKLLEANGFEKIELYTSKSQTRELYWVCAFYRKR